MICHCRAQRFGTALKQINLTVKAGEIIGIGGVAGNGQDELLSALSGEVKTTAGSIVFNGQAIGDQPPGQRRSLRVFSAPEERLGHAAVPDMSLTENTLISTTNQKDMIRNGFINWPKARAFAEQVIEPLMYEPRAQAVPRNLCLAGICKNSSLVAKCCKPRICWWSISPLGASMPPPPLPSGKHCLIWHKAAQR